MSDTTVAMSKNAALRWLVENSPVTVESYAALERMWGWKKPKGWKTVGEWRRKGYLDTVTEPDSNRVTITVHPTAVPIIVDDDVPDDEETAGSLPVRGTSSRSVPAVSDAVPPSVPSGNGTPETVRAYAVGAPARHRGEGHSSHDVAALLAAGSLTLVAAWMSVHGMLVLFPGDLFAACWLGLSLEGSKIAAASWLGRHHVDSHWGYVILLVLCVLGTATLNATGVYSRLVAAHVGPAGATAAGLETSDAEAGARVEEASSRVADIDKRIAVIDGSLTAAGKRRQTRETMAAEAKDRRERASLAAEKDAAVKELAGLKASRAGMAAKGHAAEAESAPIQYVAQLFGITRGGEEVIRWFIAGVVAMGDPFALLMIAAVSARRRRAA